MPRGVKKVVAAKPVPKVSPVKKVAPQVATKVAKRVIADSDMFQLLCYAVIQLADTQLKRNDRSPSHRCDDGGRQTPCSYCDNAKKAKQYAEAVLRAIGA